MIVKTIKELLIEAIDRLDVFASHKDVEIYVNQDLDNREIVFVDDLMKEYSVLKARLIVCDNCEIEQELEDFEKKVFEGLIK